MLRRQLGKALTENFAAVLLLQSPFGIRIGVHQGGGYLVIQSNLRPSSHRAQRLVARDREQPGGHGGLRLEGLRLAPNVQENVTDDILRQRLVSHDPNEEQEDSPIMACEENSHRPLVLAGNTSHQSLIRRAINPDEGARHESHLPSALYPWQPIAFTPSSGGTGGSPQIPGVLHR